MVSATFKEGPIFDKEAVVEAIQEESGRDYYTAHGENATFIARTLSHNFCFTSFMQQLWWNLKCQCERHYPYDWFARIALFWTTACIDFD
jgi:hypothetical protein